MSLPLLDRSGVRPPGSANLVEPADALLQRLRDQPFEIIEVHAAGGGVMGAQRITVRFQHDGLTTCVKWKRAPRGGEGWNNSPRREIGAYAVQQLFLEASDYVVPPIAARCIPLAVYRPINPKARPNLKGTRGVFGALAAWLDDVVIPKPVFDKKRFARDVRYAYHFANMNLLAYLIDHRDARSNNYAQSTDPFDPHLYSIDNGIAFGGVLFNFFMRHFNRMYIGGLPARSIERLRAVTRRDLATLGVFAELRDDGAGILRSVAPSRNVAPDVGTRLFAGGIQIGLTEKEIDAIDIRLRDLLASVDRGSLTTFTDTPPAI